MFVKMKMNDFDMQNCISFYIRGNFGKQMVGFCCIHYFLTQKKLSFGYQSSLFGCKSLFWSTKALFLLPNLLKTTKAVILAIKALFWLLKVFLTT